jgi:hypothetical protein
LGLAPLPTSRTTTANNFLFHIDMKIPKQ